MSQPEPRAENDRRRWTVIAVALLVIGLLILIPSGLCTAVFGGSILVEGLTNPGGTLRESLSIILLVLLFGALPMAVGAVLVWAGFKARQRD